VTFGQWGNSVLHYNLSCTMFDRPIRACARPSTLLGEQSKEVSRNRKREEDVWRTKLALKQAVRQVHHAIRGQQISVETATTAMRLMQWEADRAAIFFHGWD
jgi:hypothetical protein